MATSLASRSAAALPLPLLRRRLARRRLAALDVRMRVVLLVLTALLGAFTFWQARIPLDAARHAAGALGTLRLEAVALAGFVLAAGMIAAWRQAALTARPPGPEWLALPLAPALVSRHLLAEARLPALTVAPLALALWLAGLDLMPWLWSALLLAALLLAWLECTRAGAALARRTGASAAGPARTLPLATRLLVSGRRSSAARARHARPWRRASPVVALVRLDRTLSLRPGAPRRRLAIAFAFAALSALAWYSGAAPMLARAQSFVGFTLAATALGAWAVQRTCGDPSDLLRPLPVALSHLWRARFTQLAAALAVLALADAALAHAFPPAARAGQWLGWFVPGLAIATLGLHYAITLYPRTALAENLFQAWLGVALCASLMIPLMGWAVLLAGLVHSSLRLGRWHTPEAA